MTVSNTNECFKNRVGHKVVGFLRNRLPVGRTDLADGTVTLIFEDGEGLTFNLRAGSWWNESREDVARGLKIEWEALSATEQTLRDIIGTAGEVIPHLPVGKEGQPEWTSTDEVMRRTTPSDPICPHCNRRQHPNQMCRE